MNRLVSKILPEKNIVKYQAGRHVTWQEGNDGKNILNPKAEWFGIYLPYG